MVKEFDHEFFLTQDFDSCVMALVSQAPSYDNFFINLKISLVLSVGITEDFFWYLYYPSIKYTIICVYVKVLIIVLREIEDK